MKVVLLSVSVSINPTSWSLYSKSWNSYCRNLWRDPVRYSGWLHLFTLFLTVILHTKMILDINYNHLIYFQLCIYKFWQCLCYKHDSMIQTDYCEIMHRFSDTYLRLNSNSWFLCNWFFVVYLFFMCVYYHCNKIK